MRALDLFCGVGGATRGLQQAGLDPKREKRSFIEVGIPAKN
jgi:site-specific DNA-cytosine methylase